MAIKKCKVSSKPDIENIMSLELNKENGIDRNNALDIINSLKNDKLVKAEIKGNTLYVNATYPRITIDCRAPEEKPSPFSPYPLTYSLQIE